MAELIQTYRGTVMQWQCDHMNHMNVMWYVGKFDEATWNLFSMFGVTAKYLRESGKGTAALEQRLQYRRELRAGDTVTINSGILEVRDKVIRFFHEMRNNETGEIAATCRLAGVHMDAVARKAEPYPAEFLAHARTMLREYDFGDRD